MPHIPLGSRTVTAAADTTGLNAGNYTCLFDAAALNINVPFYEIYSMSVTKLATVQTVTVYVNGQVRSTAKLLGNSEWDPSQPILLLPSDQVALAWDFGSGTKPVATVWLRYDPAASERAGVF